MSYAGRHNGTSVVFCKGCEVLIDHRFVAITTGYRRFKVIGNNSCRCTAIEMKGILTGLDQILLLL